MRKKLPKILLYLFVAIFFLQIIGLVFLIFSPQATQAADIKFTPQIGIPGQPEIDFSKDKTIRPIGLYIQSIYKYAIGIVGILATIVMMFGGVLWITAMGSQEKITDAKAWITASLTGLFLALTSYIMLATINPALVTLNTPGVLTVEDSATNAAPSTEAIKTDFIGRKQYTDTEGNQQLCKGDYEACSSNNECCNSTCLATNKCETYQNVDCMRDSATIASYGYFTYSTKMSTPEGNTNACENSCLTYGKHNNFMYENNETLCCYCK